MFIKTLNQYSKRVKKREL